VAVGYQRQMPPRDSPLLKSYKRLRAVEDALFETLTETVSDEAVDAIAASFGVVERGEALYEHPDYGVLLDLSLHDDRATGQTVVERHLEETKPAAGTDLDAVLTALTRSRFTLLRLGKRAPGVGLQVEDLLFGGALFLADPDLSKDRTRDEVVIATRLLAFDGFVMTPCTSYLDFDPALAHLLAVGLPTESTVPMAERYASTEARRALATDLTRMALSSIESVQAALAKRFAGSSP